MNTQAFNDQINELAAKGRRFYSDLTPKERQQIVVTLIKAKGNIELLSHRDAETLPDLIASLIESNGSINTLSNLFNKLMEIFVKGTPEKEAYFAEEIDEALEQSDAARENPIAYLDELREQDNRQRAKDMQQENRRYY